MTNAYCWNLATGVEDGGLSWLRKSCQRMKEQAQRENRNFEDIVAEKYGVSICVLRRYILLSYLLEKLSVFVWSHETF